MNAQRPEASQPREIGGANVERTFGALEVHVDDVGGRSPGAIAKGNGKEYLMR